MVLVDSKVICFKINDLQPNATDSKSVELMLMFHPTQQESIQSFPIHLKSCIYSGTKKFLLDCIIFMISQY